MSYIPARVTRRSPPRFASTESTTPIVGEGGGPISAFVNGIRVELDASLDVVDYAEHAIGQGADATAAAYVESIDEQGQPRWGIGLDPDITTASLKAVLGALERQQR